MPLYENLDIIKFYKFLNVDVEMKIFSFRQDLFSLESKLSEGDILVHIVLRLIHPSKLDLPTKCVFPPNLS